MLNGTEGRGDLPGLEKQIAQHVSSSDERRHPRPSRLCIKQSIQRQPLALLGGRVKFWM